VVGGGGKEPGEVGGGVPNGGLGVGVAVVVGVGEMEVEGVGVVGVGDVDGVGEVVGQTLTGLP
jgi:hypothetical protein